MNLEQFLEDFRYKPGWLINTTKTGSLCITVSTQDAYHPENARDVLDIQWLPEELKQLPDDHAGWTADQFLDWVRDRIRMVELHEMDEWIVYNGKHPFDPHKEDKETT